MTREEKKEIYLKCNNEQLRQLKHFMDMFKDFAIRYNYACENKIEAVICIKSVELESLLDAMDNPLWATGIEKPDISCDYPWQNLKLLEELTDIKLLRNPYENEYRIDAMVEVNNEI